jgi:germination protein M
MTKKIIVGMATLLLAVCLLSGGCSKLDDSKINAWKDLIKIPTSSQKTTPPSNETVKPSTQTQAQSPTTTEHLNVKLYFKDAGQRNLVVEDRSIGKTEGIARVTMQELLKGPTQKDYLAVFPSGTKLLDINVKPDGLCIVDLSSEADKISNKDQGQLMVQAVANTMSQFPAVKSVSFLINGEKVRTLGGLVDVSKPIQAKYSQ